MASLETKPKMASLNGFISNEAKNGFIKWLRCFRGYGNLMRYRFFNFLKKTQTTSSVEQIWTHTVTSKL